MIDKIMLDMIGMILKPLYEWFPNRAKQAQAHRDALAEYRPAPAALQGSKEAYGIIAAHKYRAKVAPGVSQLHRRAMLWKWSGSLILVIVVVALILVVYR